MRTDATAASHLRIFCGDNENQTATAPNPTDDVTVALGDVFPLLADAVADNCSWLRDFEDEEITVSSDLYDVIMAFHHFHRTTG